ncbi:MAG: ABC transporter permease [Actinomycetota bacterium]
MKSPVLTAGATITATMTMLGISGTFWTPYDPLTIDATRKFGSPSTQHIFGTDQLGRDVVSVIWSGAQTSLFAALLAAGLAMLIGAASGIVAATARRTIGDAVAAVATVFVAFPALLLALLIVAARGPSTATTIFTVAIAAGASVAIVTRRDADDIMKLPFITAAVYCGANKWLIVRRHVLRNLFPSLIVQATGAASLALVAESTLSYLGLGTTPPTPSWGRMLASTQQYLLVHPLLTLWPALFISVTVLGFNLLGDGLRERFDPILRPNL